MSVFHSLVNAFLGVNLSIITEAPVLRALHALVHLHLDKATKQVLNSLFTNKETDLGKRRLSLISHS